MKQSEYRFLKACRRQPVDCTPVWFMRQAGRYMKEYREVRAKHSLLTICKTPDLAAEVTLQPIRKLGVDAAILFTDLLLALEPMGIAIEFAQGEGPVIHNPVKDKASVDALRVFDAREHLIFVFDTIRLVRRELEGKVPLIGFAGAPFTLASYMIEGGHSRDYVQTKLMMYKAPEAWRSLMQKLAQVVAGYLREQIRAGVQAVQIFDSWVGCLSPYDYRDYVQPYSRQIIEAVKAEGVPIIHFGTGTAALLELMREAGSDVIGIDWRIDIDAAWRRLGDTVAVQGNLDPIALMAPLDELKRHVQEILRRADHRPGHIFNLGHGILPPTPVENVIAVVDMVHAYHSG